MAQLFETLCMMLAFKESHSLAMHYCRLVWDVRSLSYYIENNHPPIISREMWEEAQQQIILRGKAKGHKLEIKTNILIAIR